MIPQKQLRFKLCLTSEEVTPHSGLAFYSEFIKRIGLKDLIETRMPRPGSNRGYSAWQYIHPILLMLVGGGSHIEDLREIIDDHGLRRLTGLNKIPSTSTVGDWNKRQGNSNGRDCINEVIDEINRWYLENSPEEELTLWSDPTIIEAEKESAKLTYKGVRGYRPVITTFKEIPIIIYHEFRHGNVHGGLLKAIEAAFKKLPRGKRIKFVVLDSEYYTAEIINYLSEQNVTFIIAADKDSAVIEAIRGIKNWRPFRGRDGVLTDREIGETIHTMEKTGKAFRLIVLRWRNPQMDLFNQSEYCYHVIATNSEAEAEEVVWGYHERGEMENVIKELKIGFSMADMPSSDFGVNAFWFSLGVLAYNTFLMMKGLLLKEEFRRKTASTIRWQLIEIAGKVIKKARQLILKVSTSIERFNEYLLIKERLERLPFLLGGISNSAGRLVFNTS